MHAQYLHFSLKSDVYKLGFPANEMQKMRKFENFYAKMNKAKKCRNDAKFRNKKNTHYFVPKFLHLFFRKIFAFFAKI